jgi:DNA-binding NarL/FixJ family response regulator
MSYEHLSPKQKQVLNGMMAGGSQTQIAESLQVTRRTVKSYVSIMAFKYHIDGKIFCPQVRLVYLRARELRLI